MPAKPTLASALRAAFSLRWSISGRLARHYFLSTALFLVAATTYLHLGLQRSLDEQDHALMASKVKVLRVLLRQSAANPGALHSEIEHEAGAESVLKYFLRVLDGDGRVLVETEGMSALLPSEVFPSPGLPADPLVPAERQLEAGHRYYLGSALADLRPGSERRILHVALDVSHNDLVLAEYRQDLALVLVAGVLVAALAGAAIARAGLHPLARISQAVQATTASRLHSRISQSQWPVELTVLAAEFDRMLERLEDSFQRLRQCTGDMAHALRNPINNLRGEAEVVLQRARSPQEYQQTLASSLEEYDRLARMIDGLLFIARADDVRTAIDLRRFEVRAEMEAVHEFYEALAAERGVHVVCEGEATLCADSMLVRRAISNLLANALKHTPAGGVITMSAGTQADGTVEIVVEDTGLGIPSEHVPHVFDRFYQADKSRDNQAKGTGLGLAIVRSIMQMHRGRASLTSELGHGTQATLHFPPPVEDAS